MSQHADLNSIIGVGGVQSNTDMRGVEVHEMLDYLGETFPATGSDTKPVPRPGSPIDPNITIDPALAALAYTLPPASSETALTAQQSNDLFPPELPYGELGEMGGKRKKLPHERAGWAEIEAEERSGKPVRKFRKGIDGTKESRSAYRIGVDQESGMTASGGGGMGGEYDGDDGAGGGEVDPAGTLAGDLAQAGREQGVDQHSATLNFTMEQSALDDETKADIGGEAGNGQAGTLGVGRDRSSTAPATKESRAEQNRKAQQAFRKRREEHIKDLEGRALALEPTRKRLTEVEERLRNVALALESGKIESAALRSALRALGASTSSSLLTPHGTIVINGAMARSTEGQPDKEEEVERAFETLARQSRELAKQGWDRR